MQKPLASDPTTGESLNSRSLKHRNPALVTSREGEHITVLHITYTELHRDWRAAPHGCYWPCNLYLSWLPLNPFRTGAAALAGIVEGCSQNSRSQWQCAPARLVYRTGDFHTTCTNLVILEAMPRISVGCSGKRERTRYGWCLLSPINSLMLWPGVRMRRLYHE